MQKGLLEREDVLAAADDALARLREGHGGALLVVGDPGTGKTSVLDAVHDRARGVATGRARGEAMESLVPLGLLEQVLRAVPGAQDEAAAHADVVSDPSAAALRALDLLARRAGDPLLLVIDDLHWADPDSLRVLAFLMRRLAALRVLVVAALRPWPADAAAVADDLAAGGWADVRSVAALGRRSARSVLTTAIGRAPDGEVEQRAWERCAGNPLLTRYVGAAIRRGEDPLTDAVDTVRPTVGLLLARFAGLDDDALRFARCASLSGTSFRPAIVAEVAGLTEPETERALEALHGAGLVADDGHESLRFVHPLIGEALYADQLDAVRRRRHARTSAALRRRGRTAEAAEQALRADDAADREAARLLEAVGRAAWRRGAIDGAVRHLEAAVRFDGDHAAPPLRLLLARVLSASGRAADGAAACVEVLRREDLAWTARLEALTLLGRCRFLLGDPDRGADELEQAVALAERHDRSRAVMPLLEHSVGLWMSGGPRAAAPAAARAVELARDADPGLQETARARHGSLMTEAGDPSGIAATTGVGRWLRSPVRRDEFPVAELVSPLAALYPFAHCAQYDDRFDECLAALDLAARRIDASGSAHAAAIVQLFRGNHLARRGRLVEALRAADEADRFAEFTALTVPIAAALRARVLILRGEDDAGRAEAERALAAAPDAWLIRAWAHVALGLAALQRGEPEASAAFATVERTMDAAGALEPNMLQWHGHAVAAHLLAGRVDDATRVHDRIAAIAEHHPSRWPRFAAALTAARLAQHRGAPDEALRGFNDALETLGDLGLPLQRAEALLAGGALLRRHAGPVAARPWLAEAVRLAETHQAEPLAHAARDELHLAGGRRRREVDPDRDRLTPAELRVAQAAASGASNAEIAASLHVSTNTVATHLRRVYAKLGVTGRGRLAQVDLQAAASPPVQSAT